jgi:hypothetical protein
VRLPRRDDILTAVILTTIRSGSPARTLLGEVRTVADLKLGPLPKHSTVKVTIVLPELLKEELDAYAAEHSKLYEPVETAALIPHMLEAFLRADRAWCSRRKQRRQDLNGRPHGHRRSSNDAGHA